MGIESELFPYASRRSLQSCAETSGQVSAGRLNCRHLWGIRFTDIFKEGKD